MRKFMITYPYFILGFLLSLIFLIIVDGRLFSQDEIYGGINTDLQTLEESTLYTPYIKNFSFDKPFLQDYYGPSEEVGLAPYPYVAIWFLGSLGKLFSQNTNIVIFIAHAFILLLFCISYMVFRLFFKKDLFGATFALALCWLPFFNSQAFVKIGIDGLLILPFFLLILLIGTWWKKYTAGFGKLFLPGLCIIGSSMIFVVIYQYLTGHHYYYDIQNTRFISPVMSLVFFMTTIYFLLRAQQEIGTKTGNFLLYGLFICFVSNFYVYYLNYLILGPVVVLFILYNLKKLLFMKHFYVAIVVSLGLLSPFLYVIFQSLIQPELIDFKIRAGLFGYDLSHSWNYPFSKIQNIINFSFMTIFIVGAIKILHYKKMIQHTISLWIVVGLYLSCILIYSFNHIIYNLIPQPQLVYRYFFPLLLLIAAYLRGTLLNNSTIKTHYSMNFLLLLFMTLGFHITTSAFAKNNFYTDVTKPANIAIVQNFLFLKQALQNEQRPIVLLSNSHVYNIFAPGILGVKTLSPSWINTIGTHDSFLVSYLLGAKILGYDTGLLFNYLRGSSPFININLPIGDKDHPYIASQWQDYIGDKLAKNTGDIITLYNTIDVHAAIKNLSGFYLFLVDQTLPRYLKNDMVFISGYDSVQLFGMRE